jgi:hypothetical protein
LETALSEGGVETGPITHDQRQDSIWSDADLFFECASSLADHPRSEVTRKRPPRQREQIGLYILSDKDYAPLYIGQAGQGQRRLLNRLNQHETDHLRNRWEQR